MSLTSHHVFLHSCDHLRARERFAWGQSDILLNLRAYQAAVASGGSYSSLRSFCEENFVNFNAVRDITSLRQDFHSALGEIGLIDPPGRRSRKNDYSAVMEEWNVNAENENLLKAILVGAFWPRVVRIRLPDAKYEVVQAGSVAKDHEAKEVKYYDSMDNSRVFIVSARAYNGHLSNDQRLLMLHTLTCSIPDRSCSTKTNSNRDTLPTFTRQRLQRCTCLTPLR